MQAENRSAQVNLRLPPTLKEAAEKAAAKDHRSLTSLIEKLLTQHIEGPQALDDWHRLAVARFNRLIADWKLADHVKHGTFSRSYRIHSAEPENVPAHRLIRELDLTFQSLGTALPNHHAFYPYQRAELAPYFAEDGGLSRFGDQEVLECVAAPPAVEGNLEMWRVSTHGFATYISTHEEDGRPDPDGVGKGFWPLFLTRGLADVVLHAFEFSRRYRTAEMVEFCCEWSGLRERFLVGPNGSLRRNTGKLARVDGRTTHGEWPVAELGNWPEVVSALGAPVMRLFDPAFDYSADWIRTAQLDRL